MPKNVIMLRVTAHQYGVICWDDTIGVDNCITAVQAFDDAGDAFQFVSSTHEGQHWAVVDLSTMRILARDVACSVPPGRIPVG